MNEFQNMPEELNAYKATEFKMSSNEAFAGSIRQIARQRKRNRERVRSSALSLTSLMLFMLIFYGVPDLQVQDKNFFQFAESDQDTEEMIQEIDSSIDNLWSTQLTASDSDELLTAIDYDLSNDVLGELAGYDDEVVQKALKRLESTEIF